MEKFPPNIILKAKRGKYVFKKWYINKGEYMAKNELTREQKNDQMALLYLKEHKITEIEQVTEKHRKAIYKILDRTD